MGETSNNVIEVDSIVTQFGSKTVHDGISFNVARGTVLALIGGSGSGKSTLLREIIGLLRPTAGSIRLFGEDVWNIEPEKLSDLRKRFGVLFQNGALFSSLSVGENIAVPMKEQMELPEELIESIVQLKLGLVGLSCDTCQKMPSELSGGMRKRVALARALALEPDVVFLDEPTSGLDPIGARDFDQLVKTLSDSLGLTIFMVTHDLKSIKAIAEQIVVLYDGKLLTQGTFGEVSSFDHPWIERYFLGN